MTTEKKARVFTAVDLNYDGWTISYKDEDGKAQFPCDKVFEFVELHEYQNLAAENEKLKDQVAVLEYRPPCELMREITALKAKLADAIVTLEEIQQRQTHFQDVYVARLARECITRLKGGGE